MTEVEYLAENNRVYPAGKRWTEDWSHLVHDPYWSDQLRALPRAEWQFELQDAEEKTIASYKSHAGLQKRINADEEKLRDNLPYDRIKWSATFDDGSGWQGSVPMEDWRKLAWGLRSIHDDENNIINWLWIKVREGASGRK